MYNRNIIEVRQESNWISESQEKYKKNENLFSKIPNIKLYQ